jgi:hypothetical protein
LKPGYNASDFAVACGQYIDKLGPLEYLIK